MQARLGINRLPSTLLIVIFAVIAALLLGGALGYAFRSSSVTSSTGPVVFVPSGQLAGFGANAPCVFVDKHKEC